MKYEFISSKFKIKFYIIHKHFYNLKHLNFPKAYQVFIDNYIPILLKPLFLFFCVQLKT